MDDEIINLPQYLLKHGNPSIRGLQSTQRAVKFQKKIQKGAFVQVLNINQSHWITVSTMNCQQFTIKVYDSFHGHLPKETKKLIADIMQSTIEVHYIDVQMQEGKSDCGVFAVAFATLIFKTLRA